MTATREIDSAVATRACPLCDARQVERLHEMRFALPDGHPLTDRYDVVSCAACGFVFADTQSSQADYDRYYADSSRYSDARTSTGAGAQAWDDRRLEETARLIAEYLPDRDARIIDIGCANGGLLKWFHRLGYRHLDGVDPSSACVAATGSVEDVSARVGTLFFPPLPTAGAECAILSHVLEHVRDVRGALGILRNVVRDGGIVYVEVPDATRYGECLVAPFQDFNVEHINHFSPVSLANALRRSGLTVEQVGRKTIEASQDVPYPALWAIARAAPAPSDSLIEPDEELTPSIESYIAASARQVADLDARLDRALAGVSEVVVWGTGQTTLTLLSSTRLGGTRVLAFTDSNPLYHGRHLAGRPVIPPEDLAGMDAPILIGSLIHHRAIAQRIQELGLPNRIISLEAASASR